MDQIALQKGLLASIKGHFSLTKGTWTIQKERWRLTGYPPKSEVIAFAGKAKHFIIAFLHLLFSTTFLE